MSDNEIPQEVPIDYDQKSSSSEEVDVDENVVIASPIRRSITY
jgi:hypothetical protein